MRAEFSIKRSSFSWAKYAFALAIAFGFVFVYTLSEQATEAEESAPPMPTNTLVAGLSGDPINGVRPRGSAIYTELSNGARIFDIGVERIALAPGTNLTVFVDDVVVGGFNVGPFRRGGLRLNSNQGDTVPTPTDGSSIEVKDGDNVIVSGMFRSPPPRPSTALFAPMRGPTIDGIMPRGAAFYAEFGGNGSEGEDTTAKKLGVFVHRVNLPADSVLNVGIDGNPIGQITLDDEGNGGLRLNSMNGDDVPTVEVDSTVAVGFGGSVIMAGTFREFDRPFPPRPFRNRVFGGRLNGRQMVPPVETNARGKVRVLLNRDRTQVKIKLAFRGLAGEQTTATINGPAHRGEVGEVIFDLGTIGGTHGVFETQTFDVTPEQVEQLRNGLWYAQIGSEANPTGEIRGQIRSRHRRARFRGDDTADLAIFRPDSGTWYVKNDDSLIGRTLGSAGDTPVSGDFDGDGVTDYAVFSDGNWLIGRSSDGGTTSKQFGAAGDIPVQGDYDGDGQMDLAIFRPSNGVWYVQKSNGMGYIIMQFGLGGDIPVASDLDGDGITDITVFRPGNGVWYWLNSSTGAFQAVQFGSNGDVPIKGDFDGDGADDLSVYRPSTGAWYAMRSSDQTFDIRQFGISTDIPVASDFDGDDITDISVFRPDSGVWYIWRSSDNTFDFQVFGLEGDIPATKH